jgi:hypothetical protein
MPSDLYCQSCASPLSYGEQFRHRLAQEVALGARASVAILGDRNFGRRPRPLCGNCRPAVPARLRHAPAPNPSRATGQVLGGVVALLFLGLLTA